MPRTLLSKFFIKEKYSIAILNAPEKFISEQLNPLPEDVLLTANLDNPPFDIQIHFTTTKNDVEAVIKAAIAAMKPDAYTWFCYPKGGEKAIISTDLNRDSLWAIASINGLKAVHQISIDETWSGLRFRLEDQ
jgi:hypothetical protein